MKLDDFHLNLKARGKGAKGWANRYCHVEYLGNNQFKLTTQVGPKAVKHYKTKKFVEFTYVENPDFASERNCRVFAQNAHCAVEIYDYYAKLFNPDYETVSVHDVRFIVQYLFNEKAEIWRDVSAWNPRIQVIPLEDGVEIKKTFDTDYGSKTLEITYTIRTGARLKHTIIFTNKTEEQRTFRVIMRFSGITSDKVKHCQGKRRITAKKHIVSPFMFFGEDNQNLKLSEYLWSLGEINEETLEWNPTTLQDIVLDVHTQGCKADIIIGNYTLAENESLLIDPDSDTWQVGASSDDCHRRLVSSRWSLVNTGQYVGANRLEDYQLGGGMRFTNITIPQGATIITAHLTVRCNITRTGTTVNSRISAEAVDDAPTFADDAAAFDARWAGRTSTRVDWDNIPAWTQDIDYDSPEIKAVIQEIIDREGWVSGNSIVIFWDDFDDRSTHSTNRYRGGYSYDGSAAFCPRLYIEYTTVTAPTITTQDADGLGIGTATLNGTIIDTGGENCDQRGFDWGYSSGSYTYEWTETGSFGIGSFSHQVTGLIEGATVYFRAKAHNSAGWGYGSEKSFVVPSGWSGTINGVTNPSKIDGVDRTNIAKVMNVE